MRGEGYEGLGRKRTMKTNVGVWGVLTATVSDYGKYPK